MGARHGRRDATVLGDHLGLLGLFGVPVAVFVVLRTVPSLDLRYTSAQGHLVIVGLMAGLALVLAVQTARSAVRTGTGSAVVLAAGCLVVGVLMLGHGLLTPGVLGQERNSWIGRLAYLAITGFASSLVLASAPDAPWCRAAGRWPRLVLGTIGTALAAVTAALVTDPTRWHGAAPIPDERTFQWIVVVVDVAVFAIVGRRHWRRWILGGDLVQFVLAMAPAFAAAASLSLRFGTLWHLSWWDYHGFLLAGFGGIVWVVRRSGRTADGRGQDAIDQAIEAAFADDPLHHIERGYPRALRTLIQAVEIKDTYTAGHSSRTARLAVELATELNLPPSAVRAITRGAYLHDLGKIGVPDAILNKPDRLDEIEWMVIRTHPTLGYELARQAPSLEEALDVILHHHERFDGGGYPAGLAGTAIPLSARVVAVADVYDALTSDRAYRPGAAPAEALAHIKAGAGSHFDPLVVRALVRCATRWGVTAAAGRGNVDIAIGAVETCHHIDHEHATGHLAPAPAPA